MNIAFFSSSLFWPKIRSLFWPSSVDKPSFVHSNCSNTSWTGMRSCIHITSLQKNLWIIQTRHSKNSNSETTFCFFFFFLPKSDFKKVNTIPFNESPFQLSKKPKMAYQCPKQQWSDSKNWFLQFSNIFSATKRRLKMSKTNLEIAFVHINF